MIIGVWLAVIICSVIVIGEIKYCCFDKKEIERGNKSFSRDWTEDVDADMDELSMEHIDNDFVSSRTLAMRGSWRLAQNQVMGVKTFNQLRQEEFSKKL